jgi:hypothetical protein
VISPPSGSLLAVSVPTFRLGARGWVGAASRNRVCAAKLGRWVGGWVGG